MGPLYIILPVFNRYAFTKACLESLRRQTYGDWKCVVVDDGSTDGTPTRLDEEFPEVEVLHTSGDRFWTETVNLGVKYALEQGAEWVMTLNNDTLCPPEFLEAMVTYIPTHPRTLQGAVAVNDGTGKINYPGHRINWFTEKAYAIFGGEAAEKQHGLHPVSYAPGRGLLVPRAAFEAAGLFDGKWFPHYYADYDFTLRCLKKGFEVVANYDARLVTYPEESGDRLLKKKKSWNNYLRHLMDIRGGGNILNFLRFGVRHAPIYAWPFFIPLGLGKRLVGYWVKGN